MFYFKGRRLDKPETIEEEPSEEEDIHESPPDPRMAPIPSPASEHATADRAAAGPSTEPRPSDLTSSIIRLGISKQYIWYLFRQYGHSIKLDKSFQEALSSIIVEGLTRWAAELPSNGNGDSQFACSISTTNAPNRKMEVKLSIEHITVCIFVTEKSTQTEQYGDKDEYNKTKSDEPTKEKSNGVSEKVPSTTTAALLLDSSSPPTGLRSPNFSDCRLSDLADSLAAPDFKLFTELNQHTSSIDQIEGLTRWAADLPSHGNSVSQFACSCISTTNTPNRKISTEHTACISVTERSTQTEEFSDKDEDKTESDESTKEKSNGVSEKVQLTTTVSLLPDFSPPSTGLLSPNLSDSQLSDLAESPTATDYDLFTELNQYTPSIDKISGRDFEPELTESAEMEEPCEASYEGIASAVTVPCIVVRDRLEQFVGDDRLFTVAPVPSSSPVSARVLSPTSPTAERIRFKLENLQLAQQQVPQSGTRYIYIPTDKVGRIVGKGGRRVKEIERETGAKIKIQTKKSAKPVTRVTLIGTEEEISRADEEIYGIIRSFKPTRSSEPTTASMSRAEETELKKVILGIKYQVLENNQISFGTGIDK